MKRIKSNLHSLHAFKTACPVFSKVILKYADREFILSIIECALNVLNGNCKLSDWSKRKLSKFKTVLRALCKKASIIKKQKLIV